MGASRHSQHPPGKKRIRYFKIVYECHYRIPALALCTKVFLQAVHASFGLKYSQCVGLSVIYSLLPTCPQCGSSLCCCSVFMKPEEKKAGIKHWTEIRLLSFLGFSIWKVDQWVWASLIIVSDTDLLQPCTWSSRSHCLLLLTYERITWVMLTACSEHCHQQQKAFGESSETDYTVESALHFGTPASFELTMWVTDYPLQDCCSFQQRALYVCTSYLWVHP